MLEVGRVVGLHGVRGELRVRLHNRESDLFTAIDQIALVGADGAVDWRAVEGARPHKGVVLVRLAAVTTAEAAQALVGRTLAVPRQLLPAPRAGEVYQHDLLGCSVVTDAGEELGQVVEFIATGSNDVCVVRGRGREYLIPLIEDVVVELRAGDVIVVRPLPGLLDP